MFKEKDLEICPEFNTILNKSFIKYAHYWRRTHWLNYKFTLKIKYLFYTVYKNWLKMDKIEDLNYSNLGGEYIPQLCKVGLGNSFSNAIQRTSRDNKKINWTLTSLEEFTSKDIIVKVKKP